MRYVMMVTMTVACLGIAGCGSKQDAGPSGGPATETLTQPDAATTEAARSREANGAEPVTVTLPSIAYAYKLAYRLDGDAIAKTQRAHVDLCNRLGPARCQMLSMEQQSGEERYGAATLKLRVATADAQHFSDQLGQVVSSAGGRATDTSVTAEDVSKAMSDTAARIRQREILVERLTEVLRTRQGKVADLVEAERSVATAQEELDQARSWLAELRGRVAYSTFEISYTAAGASPGSAGMQLSDSLGASASSFLIGMRLLLTLAIFMAPWALIGLPVWLFIRHRRRLHEAEQAATAQA